MGHVRTNNEDAFIAQSLWDDDTFLLVAIDGVGGYEGGEIASEIARTTILDFLLVSPNGERIELLKQAVTAANNAIFEERQKNPEYAQMSCVLTAVIIDTVQMQINMAHVGDTRLYSYYCEKLQKLSHDHSLIGYREEIGDLSELEAMNHPQRNVIGRDVGSQKHKVNDDDFIEAGIFSLKPNMTLLLCSDGLTDMITSSRITEILTEQDDVESSTNALVDAALDAGGKDNVTVVLYECQGKGDDHTLQMDNELPTEDNNTSNASNDDCLTIAVNSSSSKNKLKWPIVYIAFIVGCVIGATMFYIGMHYFSRRHESPNSEQLITDIDTNAMIMETFPLVSHIYSLSNDTSVYYQQTELAFEYLTQQNDSLKAKLIESEKHITQLENEIILFVQIIGKYESINNLEQNERNSE